LFPCWLRNVYHAIWRNQIDRLFVIHLRRENVSLCDFKVKRIGKGFQTTHTSQVNLCLQATLGIDTPVDTSEPDFSLERPDLQIIIHYRGLFLNVEGGVRAQ
jgi:hypothetical protein